MSIYIPAVSFLALLQPFFFSTSSLSTSKTWIQTLDPDHEEPGLRKTWTLKDLDPEKPRPWETWEIAECRKRLENPHSVILLTLEICEI